MKTYMFFRTATLLIIGFVFTLTSCETNTIDANFEPFIPVEISDDLMFSPLESPYGRSFESWIGEWMATFPEPYLNQQHYNGSNLFAVMDDSKSVYFLAGQEGGPAERKIELESDIAILVPVLNTIQTFPCPLLPASIPSPEQTVEEFLKAQTFRVLSMETNMNVTLDGLPYTLTALHRYVSDVFVIQNSEALSNCFSACIIPDIRQQAINAGYWVMLRGLTEGEHVLTIQGGIPNYDLKTDVTYHIVAK